MPLMEGRRALAETLIAEGVEYVFGNPGTSELSFMDILEEYPQLRYLLVLQEGVAMGMGDAYAQATGKPAFINLHIESGLANGLSLLYNSFYQGTPLVLTSMNADVRKVTSGRTDLVQLTRQFTKWSAEVTHAETIPGAVRRAFQEARTPPTGPVYLSFSTETLDAVADVQILPPGQAYVEVEPDRQAIAGAAALLSRAERPVVLVGGRVAQSRAQSAVVAVAELLGAPVYDAASYGGLNFPTGHDLYLGRLDGVHPTGKQILAEHDVVLAVGASLFHGFLHYSMPVLPEGLRLVQIDSDPREIGKETPADVGIVANPRVALERLADALAGTITSEARVASDGRRRERAAKKRAQRAAFQRRLAEVGDRRPMTVERLMAELAQALPPDAIVADDAVTSHRALLDAVVFDEPGSIYFNRAGALGWGMGAALGLKLSNPDRPVVAVVGDGSSMFTMHAMWTAIQYGIPVTWIICNNSAYRVLKVNLHKHLREFRIEPEKQSRYLGMEFPHRLDLAGHAQAFGVNAHRIEDPAEIGPALRAAFASNQPTLLDVIIDGSL
ncbi:MAG: thiamine pyrophosphate-binding protein [Chloroflexi bacterium]|nr:thiamine pyrophosphate-binding protein [Chloroflexota bacterium]